MATVPPPPAAVSPELASARRRAAHRLVCWREVHVLATEIAALSTTAGRAAGALSNALDLDDTNREQQAETRASHDVEDLVERLHHAVNGARLL